MRCEWKTSVYINVVGGVGADIALAVFDYRGADRVGGCLVPEC